MANSKFILLNLLFCLISLVSGNVLRASTINVLPAAAVTPQAQRTLSFYTNITLSGGTSSELPAADQMAFINATATSMGISMADVEFVRGNEIPVNYQTVLVVNEKVTVALSHGQDGNSVYNSLTAAMSHAVKVQSFTQQLLYVSKIYGANETRSCSAYNVTFYDYVDPSATNPNDDDSTSSNSANTNSLSCFAIVSLILGLALSVHR